MIKVGVKIWIGSVPIIEQLIIDKPSSLPQGEGPPVLGHWTSHSKYLGRTLSGSYLLRKPLALRRASVNDLAFEGSDGVLKTWAPDDSGSLDGWFFDSVNQEDPFLILNNFNTARGKGELHVRNPDLPDARGWVHWFITPFGG